MPTEIKNAAQVVILIPSTNDRSAEPSIVPARFNSTSSPLEGSSLVRPELNSVTAPNIKTETDTEPL